MRTPYSIFAILASTLMLSLGQELEPDDASIADGLVLWLRDAANTYDDVEGVWADASGNERDLVAVGEVGDADNGDTPITYEAGTLVTINGSPFLDEDISAIYFEADINDLMVSSDLNGDAGMENLTIFVVYNVTMLGNASITRPVGVGSLAAVPTRENLGDHFNLGSDPSVRKDNGNVGAGEYAEGFPAESLFIRSARMTPAAIDEWFNTDGTATKVLNVAGSSYTTSSDEFYLGDLRAGVTTVPNWGASTAISDFDIVQVVVYNTALSDEEVVGVNEWLGANIEGLGEKSDPNIAAPRRFGFGELPILPQQVTEIIPVKNSGETQTLTISEVTLTGPQKDHFTINSAPETIAPGSSGDISITFDMKGLSGGFMANLEVKSDDPDKPSSMIALSAKVSDSRAPINHYRLDETEGEVVVDAAGNGLAGAYVAGAGSLTLGQEAVAAGTSVEFSGGAHVLLPNDVLDVLADSFSISIWARADSVAEENQTLFARGESNPVFALVMNENTLNWLVDDGAGLASDIQSEGIIQVGMDHHIVVAYKNTADEDGDRKLTLYVDGIVAGSKDDPIALNTFDSPEFFMAAFEGILPFAGRLDDAQFYDRALGQVEVTELLENPGEPLRTEIPAGGGATEITGVSRSAAGVSLALPEGTTYDIEYSLDLINWDSIASDVTGSYDDTDATRAAAANGFYRGVVK